MHKNPLKKMEEFLRGAGTVGLALTLLYAASTAQAREPGVLPGAGVEIRRTVDGIPHLRAATWRELGLGVGYVQAQDALCTLAEAFVTYEGRRAWFFGADARPARDSTFGRPSNLELDFFFRTFADDAMLAQYRVQHPPELNQLVEGFAAGYNRFLADARARRAGPARACLRQPWLREITADDVHRRMYAAQVAAGYAHWISEIVRAAPAASQAHSAADAVHVQARLEQNVGSQPGLGSNVLAFGRKATGEEAAVLLGNPHWYWGGPDRFYQMHLNLPGRLDVAGVAFLGVPVIMIGFNKHVAWSHTVSAARRFGLFELMLDPADPTRYLVDGQSEAMAIREVAVDVRAEDGSSRRVMRKMYRTRFGPVIDLGARDPSLGWSRSRALAIRDVNAENFRVFRNFLAWNQARSLDEFTAIQHREAAAPWVNTVAIGQGDGRVWYSDLGALPNVSDALREGCAAPVAKVFARLDAHTPLLDGSRSACDWPADPTAVQPGAMPAAAQPGLLREDYVANMNDSYWLANASQPMEGFASVLGGERKALSLRGRLGHHIALELLRTEARSAQALGRRLMQAALSPRVHSAELLKNETLAKACTADAGEAAADRSDVRRACDILRNWQNTADVGDRGALLWEALWRRLRELPSRTRYRVPFSSDAPLETPRGLAADDRQVAQALSAAIQDLAAKGWTLDEPVGRRRFVLSGGRRLPLYGGCHSAGYFAIACHPTGGERLGPDAVANSYLQVVRFGRGGVQAHTLLAHGLDEEALDNGRGSAPVARYARKDWLRFPFREEEIARDPGLQRTVLPP